MRPPLIGFAGATAAVGVLVAAAIAAGLFAAPVGWAQDAGDGADGGTVGFRVEPAADAATSPRGGWFDLEVEPGDEVDQALKVHNPGDEPLELVLAAFDAATASTGGVAYGDDDTPVEATGAWIALDRDRVRLDPGASDTVAFTVTVPNDAESGQHLAGIAAWVPDDVDAVDAADGAIVAVQQRRIVAVQATLPGPAEPILRIDGIEPQATPQGVRLGVRITNEGRALTSGDGVIEVADPAFEQSFRLATFVPRTDIAYPVGWVEGRPDEGTYEARVELDYGRWTETWEGTFTIGEDVTRELDRYDIDSGVVGSPWPTVLTAVGLLGLAAAGLGLYRVVRRRRQRPRRGQPVGQAPSPPRGTWSDVPPPPPALPSPGAGPENPGW